MTTEQEYETIEEILDMAKEHARRNKDKVRGVIVITSIEATVEGKPGWDTEIKIAGEGRVLYNMILEGGSDILQEITRRANEGTKS